MYENAAAILEATLDEAVNMAGEIAKQLPVIKSMSYRRN